MSDAKEINARLSAAVKEINARRHAYEAQQRSGMKQCECKTCRIGRAMEALAGGIEEWLNESCEMEMALAYLRDEVAAVVAQPWWRRKRSRLREALRVTT